METKGKFLGSDCCLRNKLRMVEMGKYTIEDVIDIIEALNSKKKDTNEDK